MTSAALGSASLFDRTRLVVAADAVAVLLAMSLPWSTSATSILAAVYVIVTLPLVGSDSLKTVRALPAAWLPLALVAFAVVGMAWGDAPLHERLGGLAVLAKLLVMPLFFIHFQRSERATSVIAGYIASCAALLAVSLVPVAVPALRWLWHRSYGVPVKDYISQSEQFLICGFAALYVAADILKRHRYATALALLVLAALFLFDIAYVASARTAFVIFPVLVLLLGLRLFGWKGLLGALAIGAVAVTLVWMSSPYLRHRTTSVETEISQYRADNLQTSSGERLDFWKKSLRFIAAAPVIGNGTGSIPGQFRKAVVGSTGVSAEATTNPHNQTLAVGIQLGVVGIALLWAMWIAHLLLFRPPGFVSWFGLVVVAGNIVGSLFNSHLSDFTQGWMYVVLTGVAGGAVLRMRARPDSSGEARL